MNKTQVFSIALKVIGIFLFIQCIGAVFQLLTLLFSPDNSFIQSLSLSNLSNVLKIIKGVEAITYAWLGYACFSYSDRIAQKFMPMKKEKVATNLDILTLVIALQGVSLIIGALVDCVRIAVLFIGMGVLDPTYLIPLAVSLAIAGVGAWFLLKAPQIAQFVYTKFLSKYWK